jgi:phosphatidate cytidylyltransferase
MGRVEGVPFGTGMDGASASPGALGRRILSAAILLPVFVGIVMAGPVWLYTAMVVGVGALGQWEFTGMFARGGVRPYRLGGLVAGTLLTASFAVPSAGRAAFTLVLLGLVAAPLYRAASGPVGWQRLAVTLLGVCYVNWLLGYGLWLRDLEGGTEWILLLVAVTWAGETAAYAVGSLIGRTRLAPAISPKKTVEGALAQLAASILAAVAVSACLVTVVGPWQAAMVGAILGIAGQLGDLAESALKRSVGVKDAGHLIPGHGGVLDRVDGLLFNTPVLFYYAAYGRTWHS